MVLGNYDMKVLQEFWYEKYYIFGKITNIKVKWINKLKSHWSSIIIENVFIMFSTIVNLFQFKNINYLNTVK